MNVFETTAVLDDAHHLTLVEPSPQLPGRPCRVILLVEADAPAPPPATVWPTGYFESIRVEDPAFVRPAHREVPPMPTLADS